MTTEPERIAVSSQPPGGPAALIDPRFGRCANFTIADVEGGSVKSVSVVPNSGAQLPRGAGIQAVRQIAGYGVKAVISGSFGPNAFAGLRQIGIRMFTCPRMVSIKQAIDMYLAGQLPEARAFRRGMGRGRGARSW